MAMELLVATAMVILTVVIHGFGLMGLGTLLRREGRWLGLPHAEALSGARLALMISVALGLFVLHGIEIWLYAALYHGLGAVKDAHTAVYFSTITYGAIGYSDASIIRPWRLVAAIEGINGVLLIGWSTAFFVEVIGEMLRRQAPAAALGDAP